MPPKLAHSCPIAGISGPIKPLDISRVLRLRFPAADWRIRGNALTLTSNLRSKDSFVRRFIDAEFPHLKTLSTDLNKALSHLDVYDPPRYSSKFLYMLVGTAIDYRIRAYFTELPHRSGAVANGLRILNALISIESTELGLLENPWHRSHGRIAENLLETFVDFASESRAVRRLLNRQREERLCRYCVLLAHIDFIGRWLASPSTRRMLEIGSVDIDAMLNAIEQEVIDDVMALSIRFYYRNEGLLRSFNSVFPGRNLLGSVDVGGADFDFVVDQCLFDVKTTIKSRIKTEHLRQLVGYWLLDYQDEFQMRTAAIYLARQGYIQQFGIENDLLSTRRTPHEIREAFRDGIQRVNTDLSPGPMLRIPVSQEAEITN